MHLPPAPGSFLAASTWHVYDLVLSPQAGHSLLLGGCEHRTLTLVCPGSYHYNNSYYFLGKTHLPGTALSIL